MITAKIVRAVPLPNATSGCPIDFPAWVGEAMVGLQLKISWGGEGECDCLRHSDGRPAILPDNLIIVLKQQRPQLRSEEAADWIDKNDFWGGPIEISTECFDNKVEQNPHNW